MIKGNVCIELHNHNSGFKERLEGNNSLTSYLQRILGLSVNMYVNSQHVSPIISKLLGGVILIDEQLSGSDIFIPGDSNIIGTGFQGSVTNSSIIGTYNNLESGIDSTGRIYTHVWDFSTSQANGVISALGLTTNVGGLLYSQIASPFSGTTFMQTHKHILYIDELNNDVYFTLNRTVNEKIYKIHYNFYNVMLQNEFSSSPLDNQDYYQDTGKTIDCYGKGFIYGNDGYIYALDDSSSGNTIVLSKYKVSDLSFDYIGTVSYNFPSNVYIYGKFVALNFDKNRIYCFSNDFRYVYMLNTSNMSVVTVQNKLYDVARNKTVGSCVGPMVCSPNGDVCIRTTRPVAVEGYTNDMYISFRINVDGVASNVLFNSSSSGLPTPPTFDSICANTILQSGLMYCQGASSSNNAILTFANNCLCTNYNLQESVEKTVANSMKVIYTLTQD